VQQCSSRRVGFVVFSFVVVVVVVVVVVEWGKRKTATEKAIWP
jgi:hypothetical protein